MNKYIFETGGAACGTLACRHAQLFKQSKDAVYATLGRTIKEAEHWNIKLTHSIHRCSLF